MSTAAVGRVKRPRRSTLTAGSQLKPIGSYRTIQYKDGAPVFWGVADQNGTMVDISDNNTLLTKAGGLVGTAGILGPAVSTGYFTTNSQVFNITGPVTITAWVYPISLSTGNTNQILGAYKISSPFNGFGFNVGGNAISSGLSFWDGSNWYNSNSGVIAVNKWYHIAVTANPITNTTTFYVNGVVAGTATAATRTAYSGPYAIGSDAGGTNKFAGRYDSVRVYNRALSKGEIVAEYLDPWARLRKFNRAGGILIPPPTSFTGRKRGAGKRQLKVGSQLKPFSRYRKLKGIDGAPIFWGIADEGGNLVDATNNNYSCINQGTVTRAAGRSGPAVRYDGSTGYSQTAVLPSLTSYTVSFWYNAIDYTSSPVLWVANSASANYCLINSGSGGLRVEFNNTLVTGGNAVTNKWTHVAIVYNHDTQQGMIYQDGVLVGGPTSVGSYSITSVYHLIGIYTNFTHQFNGYLDDFRIYPRPLTTSEILVSYLDPWSSLRALRTVGGALVSTITYGYAGRRRGSGKHQLRPGSQLKPFSSYRKLRDRDGAPVFWGVADQNGTISDISDSRYQPVSVAGTAQASGPLGPALWINSSSAGVNFGAISKTSPGSGDFSVAVWVRKLSTTGAFSNLWAVTKWQNSTNTNNEWILAIGNGNTGSGDNPQFYVYIGSAAVGITASNTLSLNQWYRVVGVRQGDNLTLYVNGAVWGTATGASGTINSAGRNLRIGASDGSNSFGANAFYDDVRYYNYALNSQQIIQDYLDPWSRLRAPRIASGLFTPPVICTGRVKRGNGKRQLAVGSQLKPLGSYRKLRGRDGAPVFWGVVDQNGTMIDVTEDSYKCSNIGGPTVVAGLHGPVLSLNGTSQYIDVPPYGKLKAGNRFSAFVWAYPTSVSSTSSIVRKNSSAAAVYVVALVSSKLYVEVNGVSVNTGVILSNNTWYHIGLTYDGSTLTAWVNGVSQGTASATATTDAANTDLVFGVQKEFLNQYFAGRLDDVRIYNRALTPVEIMTDYLNPWTRLRSQRVVGSNLPISISPTSYGGNTGKRVSGKHQLKVASQLKPLGSYHRVRDKDGAPVIWAVVNEGGDWRDISDNHYSLTTGSSSHVGASSGQRGPTFSYDGTGGIYTSGPALNIQPPITVSAWVKFNTVGVRQDFFGKWNTASSNQMSWLLSLIGSPLKLYFYLSSNGSVANGINSGFTPSAGVWYHVVGTYDGTTRRIYINGAVAASDTPGITSLFSSTQAILLGNSDLGTTNSLNGQIDDCRIYTRCLSATEVLSDYLNPWARLRGTRLISTGPSYIAPMNVGRKTCRGKHQLMVGPQLKPISSYRKLRDRDGAPVFWAVSDQNGGNFSDLSESNRTIGISGGQSPYAYVRGPAYHFSNTAGSVANYAKYTLSNTSVMSFVPITFSAWLNISGVSNNGCVFECINSASIGGYNGGWYIQKRPTGLMVGLLGTYTGTSSIGPVSVSANTDYLVHVVYDGSHLSLYINAKLSSSVACSGAIPASSGGFPGVYIGSDAFYDGVAGYVDDCRIYNYALTPQQILEDYVDPWRRLRNPRIVGGPRSFILLSTGTASGDSTASGAGATSGGNGISTGTANGDSTATGVGASIDASSSTVAGTSTATGTGAAITMSSSTVAGTSTANGVGAALAQASSTVAGDSTATGVGASIDKGAGTSTGDSTAIAVGASIDKAAGTAAGDSTASGVSTSSGVTTGTANGDSTANGVGVALAIVSGTIAGDSTANAVGASFVLSTSTVSGTSTATGNGAAIAKAAGTAAGDSSTTTGGAELDSGAGTASGNSTATGVTIAIASASSTVSGISTANGVGVALAKAAGTAAGDSTASGAGLSPGQGVGTANGDSSANGVGAAITVSAGTITGTSTANGITATISATSGTVIGASTANGVGAALASASSAIAGTATANGVGASLVFASGTANGDSAANGSTSVIHSGAGTANGVSIAIAVAGFIGHGTGDSTASGNGCSIVTAAGNASGVSTAIGGGNAVIVGTGTANGIATASAVSFGGYYQISVFTDTRVAKRIITATIVLARKVTATLHAST